MNTTIVTGIWDIKRDQLTDGWNRSFQHYLDHLEKLMKIDNKMIIYIEEKYKNFVEEKRKGKDTLIIIRELDWFKNNDYFEKIQKIRNDEEWKNQSGWLPDSTQSRLEMYNPLVMSKMFLLNDAVILDNENSDNYIWVDGGLTNTVHDGYFWHDRVFDHIHEYLNKFSFVCFPYDGKVEIHGFKYSEMCKYADAEVDKVARGGIFGGPKEYIKKANSLYYNLLIDTLSAGLMGTEESLFTILTYKHPELFQYFDIDSDGLLFNFFENLKNKNLIAKVEKTRKQKTNIHDIDNVALYVLTFNSPEQFSKLCQSFKLYDQNFLNKPKKFLIDNSTKCGTYSEYKSLCEYYGFTHLKMKENLGICGGRQFIAEHADENNFDYHFFFEDDMFFYLGEENFCRNGFIRKIDNFYNKVMDIIWNENFDYLKWNFTEFFGDNSKQWAWYNVPQDVREQHFPENPHKSEDDRGKEPYLVYKNIKSLNGLPYATGEIYYCNWPQVVSREGNKKMFLETKWAYPYEQTWMSYIFQETLKDKIKTSVLLATPTEHDRFYHYPANERKES